MNELVKASIECDIALRDGRCKRRYCKRCPVNRLITEGLNSLPLEDQLRATTDARRIKHSVYTERKYANRKKLKTGIKKHAALALFILLLCVWSCFMSQLCAHPYTYYTYYVNDSIICDILRDTMRKVYDRDGDRKVNCIDYTITFKKLWDKKMPPNQCEIVRNRNTGGRSNMNHLFVRVRLTSSGQWLYIEPQAQYNKYNYKMSDYWGYPRYDPKYNNYGETAYWLSECKR